MSASAFPSFWGAVGLFLFSQVVALLVATGLEALGLSLMIAEDVAMVAGYGAALAVCALRVRRRVADRLFLRGAPPGTLLVVPVTILGLLLLQGLFSAALEALWPVPEWFESFYGGLFEGSATRVFMRVAVLAPVGEELLVRGAFLSAFVLRYGAVRGSVLSAVLFALMHANPWQAVPALTAGLVFAWWTLRTGSLVPALLGHVLGNGLVVALELWPEWFDAGPLAGALGLSLPVRGVLGAVLLLAGISGARRLFPQPVAYHGRTDLQERTPTLGEERWLDDRHDG